MRRLLGSLTLRALILFERARDKLVRFCLAGAFAEFGAGSVLAWPLRLRRPGGISVGSSVYIGPGSWLQTLPGDHCAQPRLVIGDGVSVSGTAVLSAAREVVLEPGVLLARNVYISDHIHRYDQLDRPIQDQGLDKIEPVSIGAGAWLGQNVVVCPGVRVGRGAVVGANSVVTSDIPDFAVAVGAPARVVKMFGAEAA